MPADPAPTAAAAERTEYLSAADILRAIRRRFFLYALIPVLAVALAIIYISIAEPVYRSDAVLVAVSDEEAGQLSGLANQFGGLASLAGIQIPSGSSNVESLALLRSKKLAQQFIEQQDLVPNLLPADEYETITLERAIKVFDQDVRSVIEDQDAGTIIVRIEWTDPAVAADWASGLVQLANSELRQRAIAESEARMTFLERELEATPVVRRQETIYGLMESELQTIMLANVQPEYAFRIIDPPRVADADDEVWPNSLIILAAALAVSFGLIVLFAILTATPRR